MITESRIMPSSPVYADRRGLSLLIALILSALILVAALGLSKVMVGEQKNAARTQQALGALYLARAGKNLGLKFAENNTVGYSGVIGPYKLKAGNFEGDVTVEIEGSTTNVKDPATFYSGVPNAFTFPLPWKGDVDESCDNENPPKAWRDITLNPPIPETDPTAQLNWALDHPCNWNKILPGQTVNIPLYSIVNGKVINPKDASGLRSIKLKLRTPCKTGAASDKLGRVCAPGDRIALDDTIDDTVVNWQIQALEVDSGGKETGRTFSLLMNTEDAPLRRGDPKPAPGNRNRHMLYNSELTEGRINGAKNALYTLMEDKSLLNCSNPKCFAQDVHDNEGSIFDFLLNRTVQAKKKPNVYEWNKISFTKPVLKFTLVNQLFDKANTKNVVPYLEYQFVSDKSSVSPEQLITATAELSNAPIKKSIQAKRILQGTIIDYAVHN